MAIIPPRYFRPLKTENLKELGWRKSNLKNSGWFLDKTLTEVEFSGMWLNKRGEVWTITDCTKPTYVTVHTGELTLIELYNITKRLKNELLLNK